MSNLTLAVKAFGKDGARLFWNKGDDANRSCAVEFFRSDGRWEQHDTLEDQREGVLVVKKMHGMVGSPRSFAWRLNAGQGNTTAPCCLACKSLGGREQPAPRELADTELLFNVLQWYSTVIVDCRPNGAPRLRGTIVSPSLAEIPQVPLQDNALCIACPDELTALLQPRLFNQLFTVPAEAVLQLHKEHPYLFDGGGEIHKHVPNLVDSCLLIGHQGHARALSSFAEQLNIHGVINLAGDKVPCFPGALGEQFRGNYIEVKHADGRHLTDGAGDGERLLDVLDGVLNTMERVAESGRVFVHCQQGRSRAASFGCAFLLRRKPAWTLHDAVLHLSRRRPEVEINTEYLQALERWAISEHARAPSLSKLLVELPQHVRHVTDVSIDLRAARS